MQLRLEATAESLMKLGRLVGPAEATLCVCVLMCLTHHQLRLQITSLFQGFVVTAVLQTQVGLQKKNKSDTVVPLHSAINPKN